MHKCEECDTHIDMHIGDYKHLRREYRCWCAKHIAKADDDAVVFVSKKWMCAIAGPETGHAEQIHPNGGSDSEEIQMKKFRKKLRSREFKKSLPKRTPTSEESYRYFNAYPPHEAADAWQ